MNQSPNIIYNEYDYFIIDVHSLFHRIYYREQELEKKGMKQPIYSNVRNQKGEYEQTNISALRTYFVALKHLRAKFPRATFVHVLDSENLNGNFRKQLSPAYKANRPPKPEELNKQLKLLVPTLKSLGEIYYKEKDTEADDIIATLCKKYSQDKKLIVYSKDKDLLQVMYNNNIHIIENMFPVKEYDEIKGFEVIRGWQEEIIKDHIGVKSKIGVYPHLVPEYLAIAGDNSDGIKGVVGIGEQKAKILINAYGNLKNFIEAVNNDQLKKIKNINNEKLKNYFSNPNNLQNLITDLKLTTSKNDLNIQDLYTYEEVVKKSFNKDNCDRCLKFLKADENFLYYIKPRYQNQNDYANNRQSGNNYRR